MEQPGQQHARSFRWTAWLQLGLDLPSILGLCSDVGPTESGEPRGASRRSGFKLKAGWGICVASGQREQQLIVNSDCIAGAMPGACKNGL